MQSLSAGPQWPAGQAASKAAHDSRFTGMLKCLRYLVFQRVQKVDYSFPPQLCKQADRALNGKLKDFLVAVLGCLTA